jgi:hypothetical protein
MKIWITFAKKSCYVQKINSVRLGDEKNASP